MSQWILAVVGVVVAAATLLNLWVSLKMRGEMADLRQNILDRVDEKYKRQDVCAAEMASVRQAFSR